MPDLWIAHKTPRKGLILPLAGTRASPNILIPLHKMSKQELAETIDGLLEKRGIPKEERGIIIEEAEKQYYRRIKTHEAQLEIKRRLEGQLPRMKKKGGVWKSEI